MTPPPASPQPNACLLLADGAVFFGSGIGNPGVITGEICFNTGLTGYQEVLTDPSYCRQIITFTFPHIGNVGCNPEDVEAHTPHAAGLVVREIPTLPSSFRATLDFNDWLKNVKLTGIARVDTRALTRHIRLKGAQNALICHLKPGEDFDFDALKKKLAAAPDMNGLDLACKVTTQKPYEWSEGVWQLTPRDDKPKASRHVVAIDYGEKLNILRSLAERGCKVTVVPGNMSAKDILALKPDGIFLSNGPGDPAATGQYAVNVLKELIASSLPLFGICLGHQLLSLALGAKTYKLPQGHRGANHPVKNLATGAVEITSQNHGFAVDEKSLPKGVKLTHVSLFDGTVEGVRLEGKPVFSVQYHPESSPGPHDSQYLFDEFVKAMDMNRKERAA